MLDSGLNSVFVQISRINNDLDQLFLQEVKFKYKINTTELLSLTLTWNDSNSDVDLHVFEPKGRHIYWSNKGKVSGNLYPFLDYDNVMGLGPEHYWILENMVLPSSFPLFGKY